MPYEPREGSGVLFPEKEKKSEKSPDFKGNILIGGKPLRLAGWKKIGKRGPFLSLSVDNKPKNPNVSSKVDEAEDDLGF